MSKRHLLTVERIALINDIKIRIERPTNAQLAIKYGICERTVERYVTKVRKKYRKEEK